MSLSLLIEKAIDKRLREIPQTLLGTIESFSTTKLTATVQPLYRNVDSNGTEKQYPLLSDVPCMSNYYGSNIQIKPNYEKGDLVIIGFSTFDYSKQLNKVPSKESQGLFGLENAVILGGIKPKTGSEQADIRIQFTDNELLIENSQAQITLKQDEIDLEIGASSIELKSTEINIDSTTINLTGSVVLNGINFATFRTTYLTHKHITTGLPPSPVTPPI